MLSFADSRIVLVSCFLLSWTNFSRGKLKQVRYALNKLRSEEANLRAREKACVVISGVIKSWKL